MIARRWGCAFNLRRNPIELVRNVPSALRSGYPKERVPGLSGWGAGRSGRG